MARTKRPNYEPAEEYAAEAYAVRQYPGIAFIILGWHTEPDEDTEWSGYEVRTGSLVAVMIGDDKRHLVDPDDVKPLTDDQYCRECGQIGRAHGASSE